MPNAISRANYTLQEASELQRFISKNKIYPYKLRWSKAINNTNFDTADTGGALAGRYFKLTWTPALYTAIVNIECNNIVTPNTTFGKFAVVASYDGGLSLGDNGNPLQVDSEGADVFSLYSNGGAAIINKMFLPLNYYVEKNKPLYIYLWADAATCTAGTSIMSGQIVFGALLSNNP